MIPKLFLFEDESRFEFLVHSPVDDGKLRYRV